MLQFREPVPGDAQWAKELLMQSNYNNAEYSFGMTYLWRRILNKQITRHGDLFLAKTTVKGLSYLFPAGSGDLEEAITLLEKDAASEGRPLQFYSITDQTMQLLEQLRPNKFKFLSSAFANDYVYNSDDLINLAGRKYHSKRNHIARFEGNNEWAYEDLTGDNLLECQQMFLQWYKESADGGDKSYREEFEAISDAFVYYDELGLEGGLIRSGGKVIAFTMGEKLTHDTYVLHFEKAYADIQGAFAMINREYAAQKLSGYRYINREDDMDMEGLRRAKRSYHPAFLVEKYFAFGGE